MSDGFHMVKLRVEGPRLFRIAGRASLGGRVEDTGYLAHCALREAFGDAAPTPFAVSGSRGRWIEFLGYSPTDAADLKRRVKCDEGIDSGSLKSKKMPDSFAEGARYRFSVRVCPVVRKARGSNDRRPGSEVDVFLAAAEQAGPDKKVVREEVYKVWFRRKWEGVAECETVQIAALRRARLLRRDGDRKGKVVERPDVTFEGVMRIKDGGAFRKRVQSGFGRHRAFGFGMILLRRER